MLTLWIEEDLKEVEDKMQGNNKQPRGEKKIAAQCACGHKVCCGKHKNGQCACHKGRERD